MRYQTGGRHGAAQVRPYSDRNTLRNTSCYGAPPFCDAPGIRARHAQPCARRDKKKSVCSMKYARSAMPLGVPCRRQGTKQQPGRRMPDPLQPAAFRCTERAAAGRQVEGFSGTNDWGILAGENGEREPSRRLSERRRRATESESAGTCAWIHKRRAFEASWLALQFTSGGRQERAAPQLRCCDATR